MARIRDVWRLLPILASAAGIGAIAVGAAQAKNANCATRSNPNNATPDMVAVAKPDDAMRFHFVNSGAGLCVLVECPNANEAVVVDCGSMSKANAMTPDEVFAYLDTYLTRKDAYSLVFSHGYQDHYTMLRPYTHYNHGVPVAGQPNLRPTRVIYGGDYKDYTCRSGANALAGWPGKADLDPQVVTQANRSTSKRPRDASDDDDDMDDDDDQAPAPGAPASKKPNVGGAGPVPPPGGPGAIAATIRARELKKGLIEVMQYFEDWGELDLNASSPRQMPWFKCGGATFYVLTAPKKPDDTNPRSVVLGIKYGTFEALLPGDAEGTTEAKALANSNRLRNFGSESVAGTIDLFAAAHHGADTHDSNSLDWVRQAAARVAIFSSGAKGKSGPGKPWMKFGHPKAMIVGRFARAGAKPPDEPCDHAFVRCSTGDSDCEPQWARAEALFSTAASGTIVVDAKSDADMVMHFPRRTSPDWGEYGNDGGNLLDGHPAQCSFPAPLPPAPPPPPPPPPPPV